MDKINPKYRLMYQSANKTLVTIQGPFTVEFAIERKNWGFSNTSSFRIYNLSEETRSYMRKDFIDVQLNQKLSFEAGYGNELATVSFMSVSQAYSFRQGTEYITQINCNDGGYDVLNTKVDISFPAGLTILQQLKKIASLGKNFKEGAISPTYAFGESSRGATYSLALDEAIQQLSGNAAFMDNEKLYILRENEYLDQDVLLINSSTGLLSTPIRYQFNIEFEMLFEPKLRPGALIRLETETGTQDMNNTVYVVQSVRHEGMISESVASSVISTVTAMPGPTIPVKETVTPT